MDSIIIKILTDLGLKDYALIFSIVFLFIDLNPHVKWNPIKSIFKFIGTSFNSSIEKEISGFKTEVNTKLESLQSQENKTQEMLDQHLENEKIRKIAEDRWLILDFQNDITNGIKFPRDKYRHIIDKGKEYDKMISESNRVEIEEDNLIKVHEAIYEIKEHYDSKRNEGTVLF